MKTPHVIQLDVPQLLDITQNITTEGKLVTTPDNFTYLDIDDAYIHQLFPLIKNNNIRKPDYFRENSIGAHISVIYPEENKSIPKSYLNHTYDFIVKYVAKVKLNEKEYYVLLIESSTLLSIRSNLALPDQLSLRGYSIDFHITIGVGI